MLTWSKLGTLPCNLLRLDCTVAYWRTDNIVLQYIAPFDPAHIGLMHVSATDNGPVRSLDGFNWRADVKWISPHGVWCTELMIRRLVGLFLLYRRCAAVLAPSSAFESDEHQSVTSNTAITPAGHLTVCKIRVILHKTLSV